MRIFLSDLDIDNSKLFLTFVVCKKVNLLVQFAEIISFKKLIFLFNYFNIGHFHLFGKIMNKKTSSKKDLKMIQFR